MTTEHEERPEYVPIGFDVAPAAPHGATTTVQIFPDNDEVRDIRGLRIYNRPGEIEIQHLSYYGALRDDQSRSIVSDVGLFDAADYNVELTEVDSVQEKEAPRFCRVHCGLVSQHRPVTLTFSSKPNYIGNLRGVFYSRRVVPADPLGTITPWSEHPHFLRFLDLSFETRPPPPACELIYYGWIGRGRAGL
jgi:hypothetical protein